MVGRTGEKDKRREDEVRERESEDEAMLHATGDVS